MKIKLLVPILFLFSLILSACQAQIHEPTRQEQLSDIGLFGRHPLKGVAPKDSITGEFSGGFFILAGLANGSISPTTEFALSWYPVSNEFIYSYIPGTFIRVIETPGLENPEIEYIFKEEWLNDTPSYSTDDEMIFHETFDLGWSMTQVINYYTEGSKLNLNNFITVDNLEIVKIHIDPSDLVENHLSE